MVRLRLSLPLAPLLAPLAATGVGDGAARVARAVTAPLDLLGRLDSVVCDLDTIATAVEAMHGEFVGMRKDIRTLNGHVVGLREDVHAVDGSVALLRDEVAGIRPAIAKLDERVDALARGLESVQALADRVGRLGWRRTGNRESVPEAPVEPEPGEPEPPPGP